ncbi:hypothetical protein GCM10022280_26140 [Sphingomonas swuensis]|uniref:histidine kinase n=1 Tax=Sphingomonas swuensis TaxID=977800 RepID=A0ABP7TC33_9SPHN
MIDFGADCSENLSHLIAETTTDAFIAIDRDNRIIYWNTGAERMLGWGRDEIFGESLHLIIPAGLREAHLAGMHRLAEGGVPRLVGKQTEVSAVCKDGSTIPVELSLIMWVEPGTDRPAGFASIMRDITQRKRLEEERNAFASRFEEQLAAIQTTRDGIAITDQEGYFTFMNPAHAAMFGFANVDDAIGVHWTSLYEPAEAERIEREAMPELASSGSWRGEAHGRTRDGREVEQEVTLAAGTNGGLICTTRDIGERLKALRDRIRTREQLLLAERQETIGRVMSGLAHDFNNLMAVISASAAVLEEESGVTLDQVSRIQTAVAAASKLLNKILKPERRTTERQSIDVVKALREVADLVGVSMSPGHSIDVDLPDSSITIRGDESEFMQVLMNLCTNARDALDASLPGQIMCSAHVVDGSDLVGAPVVGTSPAGPSAVIRVEDNGCGIAADDLTRIFEPFVTRKALGTGLGLAVVGKLVVEAGGCIFVHTSSQGSTFDLVWPLDPAETRDTQATSPTGPANLAGRTILVVDDNPALLDLITLHLERAGAEVCPCLSPRDGLEVLEETATGWHAIVVDYDMPEMNGVEFATLARQLRPEIPVVLCSAVAEDLVLAPPQRALFAAMLSKTDLHQLLPRTVATVIRATEANSA